MTRPTDTTDGGPFVRRSGWRVRRSGDGPGRIDADSVVQRMARRQGSRPRVREPTARAAVGVLEAERALRAASLRLPEGARRNGQTALDLLCE